MKAIQKELGEGDDGKDDIQEYERKIESTKLSKEAKEKCYSEIKKLKSMSPMSAESSVIRNYLDWILTIPWGKRQKSKKISNLQRVFLTKITMVSKKLKREY